MSKRLGKGLEALIPSLNIHDDDRVDHIAINQLRANPYQPRKTFDEDSIDELAESIKVHGVIQPIIVRSALKGYEIIAGERRWRASQKAGLDTVPAVVKNMSDQQVMEIALIENLQREDLNSIEIAVAYQNLMETFDLTQEELSVKVGKSRSHVANFLRLLQLPMKVQSYVSRGTISMGHARTIAALKDDHQKIELIEESIRKDWSVRELEEIVRELEENKNKQIKPSTNREKKKDPYIFAAEEGLRERFKTSVKIKQSKEQGKIEFTFYNQDDLNRLLELLQN